MQESSSFVKELEKEKAELEKILFDGIDKLEKLGLNTISFKNTLSYTNSFTGSVEESNQYMYILRMLSYHDISFLEENSGHIVDWNFDRLKELIESWLLTLSVKETLSDGEIEADIIASKQYFENVLEDYKASDTDFSYCSARFSDALNIIDKQGRQFRREHGEEVLGKAWMFSMIATIAQLDFEEKIHRLSDEGSLDSDHPIWDIFNKYNNIP